jgi:hypothetical protein
MTYFMQEKKGQTSFYIRLIEERALAVDVKAVLCAQYSDVLIQIQKTDFKIKKRKPKGQGIGISQNSRLYSLEELCLFFGIKRRLHLCRRKRSASCAQMA